MPRIADLTGQRFGNWTVLEFDAVRNRNSYWRCLCDCGNKKTVSAYSLKRGDSKSCGCKNRQDLTGKKFGKWTVLGFGGSKNGNNYWECICECGNKGLIRGNNLKSGGSTSCSSHDISGEVFGMLTVLNISNESKLTKSSYWECKCKCGNIVTVAKKHLTDGHTKSCGCLTRANIPKHLFFDGTNIPKIKSKKICKNNTSGVRGVCWSRRDEKWESYIAFKNKTYHLGLYKDLSDAAAIRKQAEEKIFGEFLEWYDSQFPKSKSNEESKGELVQ